MIEVYNNINILKEHFQDNLFSFELSNNSSFKYYESFSNNEKIEYIIEKDCEFISFFKIEKVKYFNHLKKTNASDLFLLSKSNNSQSYILDIIEFKSKLQNKKLKNLNKQFVYGYLRIISILAPLHINIENINFYICYYEEDITRDINYKSLDLKLKNHLIPYWKKNKIYIENSIPNQFFDSDSINIRKVLYSRESFNNSYKATIIIS